MHIKSLFLHLPLYLMMMTALWSPGNPSLPQIEPMDSAKLKSIISSDHNNKAVLINVWATWCAPCVKEFPDLVRLQQEYPDDLEVIFISADFPDQIEQTRQFLKKQGVNWTSYLKADKDQLFIDSLYPSWSGALPATLILNRQGETIIFLEGGQSLETFRHHIIKAMNMVNSAPASPRESLSPQTPSPPQPK